MMRRGLIFASIGALALLWTLLQLDENVEKLEELDALDLFVESIDSSGVFLLGDNEKRKTIVQGVTYIASGRAPGPNHQVAVQSWLASTPTARVVLFLDELKHSVIVNERLRFEPTPGPFGSTGAPRLDVLMEVGKNLSSTDVLCFINGDIIVPKSFSQAVDVVRRTGDIGMGYRLDCSVQEGFGPQATSVLNLEDAEKYFVEPCVPHGIYGKDYFLYKHDFWEQLGIKIPPFYVGKLYWDNWLLDVSRMRAIDFTPFLMVGHFNHVYPWVKLQSKDSQATRQAMYSVSDVQTNGKLARGTKYASIIAIPRIYCPDGTIKSRPPTANNDGYFNSLGKKFQEQAKKFPRTQELGKGARFWTDQSVYMDWASKCGCNS